MDIKRDDYILITQERIKEMFTYHEDGTLSYNKNGKKVVYTLKSDSGYAFVSIDRKPRRLHRIIFLYHHGYFPECVDHINGIRHDNRIENLRAASKEQNCLNRARSKNNSSGFKNVSWSKPMNKWMVQMTVNKKYQNIGYYEDVEFADLVAQEARNLYHGAYARHF
jgi:hypothetical protein